MPVGNAVRSVAAIRARRRCELWMFAAMRLAKIWTADCEIVSPSFSGKA
jgi:hypothetical protein